MSTEIWCITNFTRMPLIQNQPVVGICQQHEEAVFEGAISNFSKITDREFQIFFDKYSPLLSAEKSRTLNGSEAHVGTEQCSNSISGSST